MTVTGTAGYVFDTVADTGLSSNFGIRRRWLTAPQHNNPSVLRSSTEDLSLWHDLSRRIILKSHLPWFDHPYSIWRRQHIVELFRCSFSQPPVTSFFEPDIFLSTMCSDTLKLCSSANEQTKFHTRTKKTRKIVALYILISTFLDSRLGEKRFWTAW